ncbi:MAG TPA: hypothetical protein PLT76_10695 [Candidatus Omnitrophota bacterium]|nr:hypothetical protein [Candidatus Omnitrophota bacterium]
MILLTAKLLYALLLPWMFGVAVISSMKESAQIPGGLKYSLAYGCGIGVLTLWLFIAGIYQVPFDPLILSLPLLIVIVRFLLARAFTPCHPGPESKEKTNSPAHEAMTGARKVLSWLFRLYILYYVIFVF